MAEFIINEVDIFKYVVGNHSDLEIIETVKNGRKLIQRIPINIFKDEYNIIYDSLVPLLELDMAFSYDSLQQVMSNNKHKILENEKVELYSEVSDETVRFDYILQAVLTAYSDLCEEEVPEHTFSGNLELYISNWADFRYEELLYQTSQILSVGYKVGRRTLRGREDADYHYKQVSSIINGIVESDANLLAESIDTSVHTASDIEEIHNRNEIQQENLGFTGISSLDDEMLGLFKGEMVAIQGGSGSGKSRFAINLAKNIMNNGHNVLIISLEQKANRLFNMLQAKHLLESTGVSRITDRDMIRNSYSPADEHLVSQAREDIVNRQDIGRVHIEGKYLMAKDILMELETIWEDFKFDAVILDYFGLLGTEKDRYNELTDAVNLLKSACKSFKGEGFCLIVPNQLSKEAEKELMAGRTEEAGIGGSETAYLFRGSDVVLTINRPKEMRDDNQMELITSKMRLGTLLQPIKVQTDLGHCTFTEIQTEESEENVFGM